MKTSAAIMAKIKTIDFTDINKSAKRFSDSVQETIKAIEALGAKMRKLQQLRPIRYTIIESPCLEKDVCFVGETMYVKDFYKFIFTLNIPFDEKLDLCFSHAKNKIHKQINLY